MSRRSVIVFANELLPISQTFILEQGENLRRFEAVYAGSRPARPSLAMPTDRTVSIAGNSRLSRVPEAMFKFAGWAPGFAARLAAREPALMHAHFGPYGLLALPLARRLKIPLMCTFHGTDATQTDPREVRGYVHRRYIRQKLKLQEGANLFLAVSRYLRQRLIDQGYPADRIETHYTGLDTTPYSPDLNAKKSSAHIIAVGRMVEVKGHTHLIDAMELVQQRRPDAKLILIGDGPLRPRLQAQARGQLRNFEFTGAVAREVVRSRVQEAAICCVPSIPLPSGQEEGFGMCSLEAQALKTPVIASRTGGLPETLIEDVTGLLVRPGDPQDLSRAILECLSEPDRMRQMGEAGAAHVRQNFEISRQNERLEAIYSRIQNQAGV